jgi:toxin ParE1/3/4
LHYGHVLRVDGLRSWPLKGFPYRVFYNERSDRIDALRVLHTAMDIPDSMIEAVED